MTYRCCCRKTPFETFKGLAKHLREVHPCAFYELVDAAWFEATITA